jgi:Uma2 family endonuclease
MREFAAATDKVLSLEEFESLPEEDGYKLELVRGMVVREPRPGYEHGWVLTELLRRIHEHVRKNELGEVFTDVGTILNVDPPTVRGPDIAFVSSSRMSRHEIPIGFSRVPPDLCVEVVSPSNTAAGIREKVLDYFGAGVRLIWVVYPRTRTVAVHASPAQFLILQSVERLDGGAVLPGFSTVVAELFPPRR